NFGGVKSSSSWIRTSAPLCGAYCRTASLAPSTNSQERQRLAGRRGAIGCSADAWPSRAHWNVMSTHFDTSEPRPEAIVVQPRTFCLVLSLAHTAKPPGPKNELVFGGSVS